MRYLFCFWPMLFQFAFFMFLVPFSPTRTPHNLFQIDLLIDLIGSRRRGTCLSAKRNWRLGECFEAGKAVPPEYSVPRDSAALTFLAKESLLS